jgi:hypothetical protein
MHFYLKRDKGQKNGPADIETDRPDNSTSDGSIELHGSDKATVDSKIVAVRVTRPTTPESEDEIRRRE